MELNNELPNNMNPNAEYVGIYEINSTNEYKLGFIFHEVIIDIIDNSDPNKTVLTLTQRLEMRSNILSNYGSAKRTLDTCLTQFSDPNLVYGDRGNETKIISRNLIKFNNTVSNVGAVEVVSYFDVYNYDGSSYNHEANITIHNCEIEGNNMQILGKNIIETKNRLALGNSSATWTMVNKQKIVLDYNLGTNIFGEMKVRQRIFSQIMLITTFVLIFRNLKFLVNRDVKYNKWLTKYNQLEGDKPKYYSIVYFFQMVKFIFMHFTILAFLSLGFFSDLRIMANLGTLSLFAYTVITAIIVIYTWNGRYDKLNNQIILQIKDYKDEIAPNESDFYKVITASFIIFAPFVELSILDYIKLLIL